MDIDNIKEWFQIADEDFYSAKILNEAHRKPFEIICYHCAQAVEKYMKGYLTYKEVTFQKTHNLMYLLELCVEKDSTFEKTRTECGLLNLYNNEIRYPDRIEVKIENVNYSLSAVERIKDIEPLKKLRELIENPEKSENEDNK